MRIRKHIMSHSWLFGIQSGFYLHNIEINYTILASSYNIVMHVTNYVAMYVYTGVWTYGHIYIVI